MSQNEGNAQTTAAGKGEIRTGDIVGLTEEALKSAPRLMGPIKLYSVGWPNAFQVVHTFVNEENHRPHLTIAGCCYNLVMNRKSGARLCSGHDAKWFKKLFTPGEEPEVAEGEPKAKPRERRPGDRLTSLETPWGEAAAIEYLHDEHNPMLLLRAFGYRTVLNGQFVEQIVQLAKDKGVI